MKISRRGASANHGVRSVELKKLKYEWNEATETFDIVSGTSSTDFNTLAHHKYKLKLTLPEVASFVKALGMQCKKIDADEFVEAFGETTSEVFRIMARASAVS
jgi:hypothetical protein